MTNLLMELGKIVQKKETQKCFFEGKKKKGLEPDIRTRIPRYAIDELKADAVMEMDADFQHDPNDIPRFVKRI